MTEVNLQPLLQAATRAHNGTSFDPEKRGEQMIIEYTNILQGDLELISGATDEVKELYISRFTKYLGAYISARSRIVSPMISGGSNFPVRQQQKYHRWEDSTYNKFKEFRNKAINGIQKQIERDKPQEQKEREVWQSIKATVLDKIATIVSIDTGVNTYTSRQLIVSNLTSFVKRLAANGQTDHVKKVIALIQEVNQTAVKPIVTENNAIFSLVDVATAQEEKKHDLAKRENKTFDFNGGQVIINYEIDRVQIKHETKPAPEVITALKKNAFKWSPSQGVWQRQLTMNAVRASNQLTGLKLG